MPNQNIITSFQQWINRRLGWEDQTKKWEDQSKKFINLIYARDLPGVTKMLDEGVDVNTQTGFFFAETPLIKVIINSMLYSNPLDVEMIKLLIRRGADVNNIVSDDNRLLLDEYIDIMPANTSVCSIYFMMFQEEWFLSIHRMSNRNGHSNSLRCWKCDKEVLKLLISNGCSVPHCIQVKDSIDEHIVDIFLPRAITLADNNKALLEFDLSVNDMYKLPDELIKKITTEMYMPIFRQQLKQMCDIDETRAYTIHQLIVDRIKNLNSEQLAIQRSYILRDDNLFFTLKDTVFARIIGPIRKVGALDPKFKGSQFKTAFTDVFKEFISDKTIANLQIEGREKMFEMAQQIADQNAGQKNLTVSELKIIFSVILSVVMNNQQQASQIIEPLNEERALEELNQSFTALNNVFDEFVREFKRIAANVEIKSDYFDNITLTIEKIEERLGRCRSKIMEINTSKKNLNKNIAKLHQDLQNLIKNHQKLAEETSYMKNPTVVQTIKNYLQKAAYLISKLFAAVANFFRQTLPNKASKAKTYLTTCFSNFKKSEENLVTSNNVGVGFRQRL